MLKEKENAMKAKFTSMLTATLFALVACNKPAPATEITAAEWKEKADKYEVAEVNKCVINYSFGADQSGTIEFTKGEGGGWGTKSTDIQLMMKFSNMLGAHVSQVNPNNFIPSTYNPEIHFYSDMSITGSYTVDAPATDTTPVSMYDSETLKYAFDSNGYLSHYEAKGQTVISGIPEEEADLWAMFGYVNGTTNINDVIDFTYSKVAA